MSKKILVYGWFNKGNIGDELFKDSYKQMFPDYSFNFTDYIRVEHLKDIDAIFIGGGSLLGGPVNIASDVLINDLKKYKIFYLGVGGDSNIHASHKELLSIAKLVALRDSSEFNNIKTINSNTIVIPDLVYNLPATQSLQKKSNSVLVIPNSMIVPKWNSPHWMHASWDYFKIEFAQFLEELLKDKIVVNFLPFCINDKWNDCNAIAEISSRMNNMKRSYLLNKSSELTNSESITNLISQYQVVITQRFHGTILSEMAGTSCLTIHHHDKLKNTNGTKLSYYGLSKALLHQEVNSLLKSKVSSVLPIDRNIFIILKQSINDLLD